MSKYNTKIKKKYEKYFAEALASRWAGFYQYAEELLLKCYKYYKRTRKNKELSEVLKELVDIYMESEQYPEALEYVRELLDLFSQFGTKINIANTFNDLGRIYQNIGNFNLATDYFKKSLKTSKKINYQLGISIALTNLATQLRYKGKFEDALTNLFTALEICQGEGYHENLVAICIAIAIIYSDLGRLDNAEEYLIKAENYLSFVRSGVLVATYYNEVSNFYRNINDIEKSIEFINKGIRLSQAKDFEMTHAQLLLNFGLLMVEKRELNTAYNYFTDALEKFRKFNNKRLISQALTSLGILFLEQNNVTKAIKYLKDSQNIANNENDILVKIRNYRLFGKAYKNQKKYFESYRNYTQCLFHYQQLLNNIHTIPLKESLKETIKDLDKVVYELNNLIESGNIKPDVSELIKTNKITIQTCKKAKAIYPNISREKLIEEIERHKSITNNLKGSRLETDARRMLRREMNYDIYDTSKNWIIKENELAQLVEENCYKDYSNKSIELDIYGSKEVNGKIIYILGECKYRNKPISPQELKCFIIKSNIIAKYYLNQFIHNFKNKIIFHLILISLSGFPDKKVIDNLLNDFWDLSKDKIHDAKLEIIDKEVFIRLLKKNKISSNLYENL